MKNDDETAEPASGKIPAWLAPVARLLLTPDEAAAAPLRISPRLLWSRTKSNEIPCVRIGKAVRYSLAALQAINPLRPPRQRPAPGYHKGEL